MKNKWLMMAAVAVVVSLSESVQALPTITGNIQFTGGVTVNTGNLTTATAISSYSSLSVQAFAETGSYLPLNLGGGVGQNGITALSFTPFSFGGNVLGPSNPLIPLWTVTLSGITYSFDANSVTIATQNSGFLNLTGTGTAHITGFQDTAGTWTITDTGSSGPTFTFGASSTAVPDGGTTMVLLGAALSGLGLIRKKLMA